MPQAPRPSATKMDSKRQAPDLGGKSYYEATRELLADPDTSYVLRKRIAEDDQRDPHEAFIDAEVLHSLQSKRFREQGGGQAGKVDNES